VGRQNDGRSHGCYLGCYHCPESLSLAESVDDYLIFLKNNMPNKLIKWSIGLQIHIRQRFILIEVIK
jgi:hypothetical protein